MSGTFFKSVRPDSTDFHTGMIHWLPAEGAPIPEGGWLVEHPHPGDVGIWDSAFFLSASTVETDCSGFKWPARLLIVEPVGAVWTPHPVGFPHKRASIRWRVVEELPAWRLFGPQGREVTAIIEQAAHLTIAQIADLHYALDAAYGAARSAARAAACYAAQGSARVAARSAARGAVWDDALDAARGSAWDAAWAAALGWLVKDRISDQDFRTLTGQWEQVMGRSWEVTA